MSANHAAVGKSTAMATIRGAIDLPLSYEEFHPVAEAGRLATTAEIRRFVLAGNATITVRSLATGQRFTYRVREPAERRGNRIWFVSLLYGPDNEASYVYIGQIRDTGLYDHGRRARIGVESPAARAFIWLWNVVQAGREDALLKAEVWHEGKCGRCGRKLTVPESIKSGFGPECIGLVGGAP